MAHRLVAITGISPGAGKSTISARLGERAGARLLSEDDLLGAGWFGPFDRALGDGGDAIAPLLDGTRRLAEAAASASGLLVVDAIVPGFFWLFGRYERSRITAAAQALADILVPTAPLLVYLTGDADTLFARAVAERGEGWSDRIVRSVGRWRLPHYSGAPVTDEESLAELYTWLHEETQQLLAEWPVPTIMLDAARPIDEVVARVAERLGRHA